MEYEIIEALKEAIEEFKAKNELKSFIKSELVKAMNEDEPKDWITIKGNKVPIFNNKKEDAEKWVEDKKKENNTKFFEKWNNAPKIKLKPRSEWKNIQDIKELRKEVKKYLVNDLKKIPLKRKELGDIRFSNKSIDEYISYSADRDKLLSATQIPEFITQGTLGEYFESAKDRSKQDTIKGFYPIYFNLETSTKTKKAEILIGKDENGNLFFDMFLDYDREKANKKGF